MGYDRFSKICKIDTQHKKHSLMALHGIWIEGDYTAVRITKPKKIASYNPSLFPSFILALLSPLGAGEVVSHNKRKQYNYLAICHCLNITKIYRLCQAIYLELKELYGFYIFPLKNIINGIKYQQHNKSSYITPTYLRFLMPINCCDIIKKI